MSLVRWSLFKRCSTSRPPILGSFRSSKTSFGRAASCSLPAPDSEDQVERFRAVPCEDDAMTEGDVVLLQSAERQIGVVETVLNEQHVDLSRERGDTHDQSVVG